MFQTLFSRSSSVRISAVVVAALALGACNSGVGDSLLLTGLRSKPDESLVQRNVGLELPSTDQLVLPGQLSEGSIARGHEFQVTKILYGDDAARAQAQQKIQSYRPNSLPSTEQQLLQIAGADSRGVVRPQNVGVGVGESSPGRNRNWKFGDPLLGPRGLWFRGLGN